MRNAVRVEELVDDVDEGQEAVNEMRRAASEALRINSKDIVECLVENVKKGHPESVKTLREMACAPKKSVKERRRSRAKELAEEPLWTGDNKEEVAVGARQIIAA
jgi:hypothetical protein